MDEAYKSRESQGQISQTQISQGQVPQRKGRALIPFLLGVLSVAASCALVLATIGIWNSLSTSATENTEAAAPLVHAKNQRLKESVTGTLSTQHSHTQKIGLPLAQGTVTRTGTSDGETLGVGDVLVVVDEKPIVVFPGDIPAFREMKRDIQGADVLQLQRGLAQLGYTVNQDGIFDESTGNAYAAFLKNQGFEATDANGKPVDNHGKDVVISRGTVIYLSELPGTVRGTCGTVGTAAPIEELCSISSGDITGYLSVSDGEEREISAGMPVQFSANGRTHRLSISGKKPVKIPPAEGQATGSKWRYELTGASAELTNIPQDSSARIIVKDTQAEVMTVPIIALQGPEGDQYVKDPNDQKIQVDTGICVRGFCEIKNSPVTLHDGTALKVADA